MNLRRGLLRLWLVFSIAWIIAVGFHAYRLWPTPIGPWTYFQASKGDYPVIQKEDLPKETQPGVVADLTPVLAKYVSVRLPPRPGQHEIDASAAAL
jgi:hypothetical protein